MMKWENWELADIDKAIENIYSGSSIYSETMRLWKGEILYRTWDSIRSKIGRSLRPKMTEKFKINDLVEVTKWKGDQGKNWLIVDFASNGGEAIVRNIFSKARSIVLLSDLKHQKKPKSEFELYKAKYPHVPKKELRKEWEDNSGDLRMARISTEKGNWP